MRSLFFAVCLSCAAITASCSAQPVRIGIDGRFDDWANVPPLATDPPGDATNLGDITRVYAASAGAVLYVRFDIGATLNLASGVSSNEIPRLVVGLPGGSTLTANFRTKRFYLDGNTSNTVSWATLGFVSAPTYAASEFELKMDLAPLGVQVGDTVTINFEGSDSLASPAPFTMNAPAQSPARRPPNRFEGTDLRVASLNTYNTGLLDGGQFPGIVRLMRAAKADVYAFQEEYNSSAAQVANAMNIANPFDDGRSWHVHKVFDNAIASWRPITPIPSNNSKYAAAAVDMGDGHSVVVITLHPKCCGHIGSEEDVQRIAETQGMVDTIMGLRNGTLGEPYLPFQNAGIVLIGDWNLVGSRTPLDMLTGAHGPNLRDWILPNLIGDDAWTWIGYGAGPGSFTPGRLDLVNYSAEQLLPRNGYVLDSRLLNPDERNTLGLQANDSASSDHLLLVTDFRIPAMHEPTCPGDVTATGFISEQDVAMILQSMGSGGGPADVDGNGIVNINDLIYVVMRVGVSCR